MANLVKTDIMALTMIVILLSNPVMSQTQFIYGLCSTKKYAPNTPYAADVNGVINKLTSTEASVGGYFRFGQGSVNGIIQCRGDVSRAHCIQCAKAAAASIKSGCKNAVGGRVQHEHCFLRYESYSFASKLDLKVVKSIVNTKKSTAVTGFGSKLQDLLVSLPGKAPRSPKMFAAGKVGVKPGVTIYAMVTCLRSLSALECSSCLSQALKSLSSCCASHVGAQVHMSSCNVRFETYNFLDIVV